MVCLSHTLGSDWGGRLQSSMVHVYHNLMCIQNSNIGSAVDLIKSYLESKNTFLVCDGDLQTIMQYTKEMDKNGEPLNGMYLLI